MVMVDWMLKINDLFLTHVVTLSLFLTHTQAHTHMCTQAHTHACKHTHTRASTHTCVRKHTHTHTKTLTSLMVVGNPFILIQNFFFGACHNINQIHQGNREKKWQRNFLYHWFMNAVWYTGRQTSLVTMCLHIYAKHHWTTHKLQHSKQYIRIVLSVVLKCNCTKSTKI